MSAALEALRAAGADQLGPLYECLVLETLGVSEAPWGRWTRAYASLSTRLTRERETALAASASGVGNDVDMQAVAALVHGQRTFLALVDVFRSYPPDPAGLSDMGSGSGAAALAAATCGVERLELVDLAPQTLVFAQELLRRCGAGPTVREGDLRGVTPGHASVVAAYSLNELRGDALPLVQRWLFGGCRQLYVLEPGTLDAAQSVQRMRDALVSKGHAIVAPCTHTAPCPLLLRPRQWCHVSRASGLGPVARRLLTDSGRDAHVTHFSWLVVGDGVVPHPGSARVVARPPLGKGKVCVEVCGVGGIQRLVGLTRHAASEEIDKLAPGEVVGLDLSRSRPSGDGVRVQDAMAVRRLRRL